MTETAIIANPLATPLAALLCSQTEPPECKPEMGVYRGALTPRNLDAAEREVASLLSGAAVHDLGWLRRVAVLGEDRFRWLNGMVTNAVNDLATNSGAWNLVLNAQGRILGDLHVWREGAGVSAPPPESDAEELDLELEIAADQYERLLEHLKRFIIMDDVELVALTSEPDGETALGVSGPLADAVLERLGLPALAQPLTSVCALWNGPDLSLDIRLVRGDGVLVPHYQLWLPEAEIAQLWQALVEAGANPVGSESLESIRIAEGIPAYGTDMIERDLPQETSQMRALNFNKGCYQGQEIVERIRSRGSVHRHLRQLELDGPLPEPGAELTFERAADGVVSAAGQITSAARVPLAAGERIFALGMIRGEAELGSQPLSYKVETAVGTARILAAPPQLGTTQQVRDSANEQ